MESLERIIELLERFYKGETTLDEEKYLEQFFNKGNVPEALFADKELFLVMKEPGNVEIPDDLNVRISDAIDRAVRNEFKTRRISWYSLSGLAAGLLVLISVYLFFLKDGSESLFTDKTMEDTYDDPIEAYEEAKRTLAYVSNKFNEGTSELQHIQKVNRTVENLQPLTLINKGNKEIRLLKQLEKAGEITRQ